MIATLLYMQQIGLIAKKHSFTNKKGEEQLMNINAIPDKMEKYMVFMLDNHLTFIDSFQLMSSATYQEKLLKYTLIRFDV